MMREFLMPDRATSFRDMGTCKVVASQPGGVSMVLVLSYRLHARQMANQAGAYRSFCSMKRLGVFLLLPGWDANP